MAQESHDEDMTLNRRRTLKSMSATAAAVGGVGVGSASASSTKIEAVDEVEYDSVEAVEGLFENHQDALEAAYEFGALEAPEVDELGIETLGEPSTEDDAIVAFSAKQTAEGMTPLVTIQRETDAGFLDITLRPEEETTSAALFDSEGEVISAFCLDCDEDCDCNVSCTPINNSATCPKDPDGPFGYDVNYSCDCGGGGW